MCEISTQFFFYLKEYFMALSMEYNVANFRRGFAWWHVFGRSNFRWLSRINLAEFVGWRLLCWLWEHQLFAVYSYRPLAPIVIRVKLLIHLQQLDWDISVDFKEAASWQQLEELPTLEEIRLHWVHFDEPGCCLKIHPVSPTYLNEPMPR